MINIVKLLNGNVAIYDNTSGDFLYSLSPAIIEMQCSTNGTVRIVQNNDNFEFFDPAQVANTQVLPAAAIAFSGTCADLADILATDFFFELTDTIDAIDVNYDNTSSGLTSTNVQDAIDELAGTSSAPNLTTVLTAGNSAGNLDILDLDKLDFNTATIDTASEGQLVWNTSAGTLDLGLKGGNTILNVGQQIITRVVNKTTPLVPLTKAGYQVVLVAGATGQRLSVKLAKADNDTNSAGTLGIVCENIAVNQEGFIVSVGPLTEINTTGSLQGETWSDGDLLYLSPTTFGAITNVKPSAPFHEVRVGYVEYAHAIHGKIYVKIDNGYEIDELHNVDINSPANNEGLFYNSATTTWQNKTINTALGYTPVTDARTISTTSPLSGGGDLTANRTISIQDAAADGTTKGAATFSANDFNSTSGLISIDYTNGQSASGSNKGFLTSSDWTAFNGKESVLTFSSPLSRSVNTISIPVATSLVNGYLSSTDWTTFNNKQNALGFTPVTNARTLTINGTAYDLTADRTWSVGTVTSVAALTIGTSGTDLSSSVATGTSTPVITLNVPTASATNRGVLSSSDWSAFNGKQNALGYTPVPETRTLTINGSTQDLSANRTFTIADPEGWTVIVKSANQNVIGSTMVDDTELQFSVVSGGNYMLQLILATSGNSSTDDYKFDFALSSGLMIGGGNSLGRNAVGATQTVAINAVSAISSTAVPIGQNGGTISSASGIITVTADFGFYVNSNTTFKVRFACNAGTTSTARTWKGSILKYKRID